jgi:hypothetical protein
LVTAPAGGTAIAPSATADAQIAAVQARNIIAARHRLLEIVGDQSLLISAFYLP